MIEERSGFMSRLHPAAMFVFSSLGVIVIGFVFQIIAMLLAVLFFDVTVFELGDLDAEVHPEVIRAVKFIQIIGALGTFVFSSLLLSFFYTGRWLGFFSFGRDLSVSRIVLLIIIMVSALPLVNLLTELNMSFQFPFEKVENYLRGLEDQTESLMMKLIVADSIPALLLNLFMIALIPAVGEELVFRGLIQKHLTDIFRNPHIGVILASIIFSLAHFQFYSFLPRFFLGMLLGYMLVYGKSLWYPIMAHLLNNGMGVIFYYFHAKEQAGETLEEFGTTEMMPIAALVSFLLVSGMMYGWAIMVKPARKIKSQEL